MNTALAVVVLATLLWMVVAHVWAMHDQDARRLFAVILRSGSDTDTDVARLRRVRGVTVIRSFDAEVPGFLCLLTWSAARRLRTDKRVVTIHHPEQQGFGVDPA